MRQALSELNRPQIPTTARTPPRCPSVDRANGRSRHRSTKKCTEPVAPSSGLPTDRRRSDCRSEGHQPRTLRTRCIGDSRGGPGGRQGARDRTSRILRVFLFAQHQIAFRRMCSSYSRRDETAEPGVIARGLGRKIRRAGNAFVHLPDRLSASAYSCSGGFVLPAPRARRRDESMQGDLSDQDLVTRNFAQFAHVSIDAARTAPGAGRD